MKTLTLEQAKNLKKGTILIDLCNHYKDGTPARVKVIGLKTWKRSPERVQVSIKFGLYQYDKFTEEHLSQFALLNP